MCSCCRSQQWVNFQLLLVTLLFVKGSELAEKEDSAVGHCGGSETGAEGVGQLGQRIGTEGRIMSTRVCSPPSILDRVASNVSSTPEDLGDCPALPTAHSHPEPEMSFLPPRRSETSSTTSDVPSSRRRTVSRNLFGSPTPTSVQYARDKLLKLVQKESERWNFDFEAERPLPGRYRWEAVEGEVVSTIIPPPSSPLTSSPKHTPLSPPSQPKQRRLDVETSPEPLLLVVTSGEASMTPPRTPDLKRKAHTPGPKLLFPPAGSQGCGSPSGQPINPVSQNVLVKATVVDPQEENPVARKYLTTDSSRRTPKQMKITMYSSVKKRRMGQATPGTEKKAAI